MNYDLNLFSLNLVNGQQQDYIPGFYATFTPKRAARGREDDALIVHLDLHTGNPLPANEINVWLNKLADSYFKLPGSVTSAMRLVIDQISNTLLERNLKLVSDRDRQSAFLNLAVIHRNTLFVAQCGRIHGYWVGQNAMEHFFDPDSSDRSLGLTRTPSIRFYQHDMAIGDSYISTPTPSTSWDESHLIQTGITGFEQLWRRLHHNLPANMSGGLVLMVKGSGRIVTQSGLDLPVRPEIERSVPVEEETPTKPEAVMIAPPVPVSVPVVEEPEKAELEKAVDESELEIGEVTGEQATQNLVIEEKEDDLPELTEGDLPFTTEVEMPAPEGIDGGATLVEDDFLVEETADLALEGEDASLPNQFGAGQFTERERKPEISKEFRKKGISALAKFFNWSDIVSGKVKKFFGKISNRLFPGAQKENLQLSKGSMIAIAIIVPILIVALATSVYITRGKTKQYDYMLAQAQAAADNAQVLGDPASQRTGWQEVIKWADQAKTYRQSAEIDRLVLQAENAIDDLDGAARLSYKPAINGVLPDGLVISRVIPITNDLYLFDSTGGRIVHLTLGNQGYVVDSGFTCYSGTYSGIAVGDLVGMVAIPINNAYKAPIMGIDRSANLLYCAPGMSPVAAVPEEPEDGIGNVKSIALDSGNLFILDPVRNALWVYPGSASQFTVEPSSFFEEFPLDLSAAIDLAVNGDELYILFEDGQMATCIAPGFAFSSISCTNPAPYIDPRENAPAFDVSKLGFSQVMYVSPRDPSVMLLASDTAEIYQFSSHLALNKIFRSRFEDGLMDNQKATSFAITSNRYAFMAFGNELFYAVVP